MKHLFIALIALFGSATAQQNTISIEDFEFLNHTSWKGELTYLDYQSGEQTTVATTLQLSIENDRIVSNVQYTYEPNKNQKSKVKIRKNGTYFGDEKVISFTVDGNTRTLKTIYTGKDAGKKADFIKTYTATDITYTITKEVVYKKSGEKLIRNTYKYRKI